MIFWVFLPFWQGEFSFLWVCNFWLKIPFSCHKLIRIILLLKNVLIEVIKHFFLIFFLTVHSMYKRKIMIFTGPNHKICLLIKGAVAIVFLHISARICLLYFNAMWVFFSFLCIAYFLTFFKEIFSTFTFFDLLKSSKTSWKCGFICDFIISLILWSVHVKQMSTNNKSGCGVFIHSPLPISDHLITLTVLLK